MKVSLIAVVIMMIIGVTPIHPLFFLNGIGESFGEQDQKSSIESLIITASSNYLQSQGNYIFFLNGIEIGNNSLILKKLIEPAIAKMSTANDLYINLRQITDGLGYNEGIIEKLKNFNYSEYQTLNNLNPSIFQECAAFMVLGNLKEIFKKISQDTSTILQELNEIKTDIESNKPVIDKCRRLNQSYQALNLFGQYVAEVFACIE